MDQFGVGHLRSKAMKLNRAQAIVAYSFVDTELLWEALQAAGSGVFACDNGRRLTTEGNKPLAAVGDSVLSLYYKVRGRDNYHSIGQSNASLNGATSNDRLALICDTSGLTACVNGNPSQYGVVSPKTKAAMVEAVLGAIFEDTGRDGRLQAVGEAMIVMGIIETDYDMDLVTFNTFPRPHI
ncbi:hypothetical protein Daus18300_002938 [Diaporthe australafricana]|uniref:RNase III domain-containing protein n=1 Tax=Diaporthe australafricana TaxID=127596 RepID=A0ABR3XK12_9PEZI